MDNFFKSLVKVDGGISSKRVTAMVALVLYVIIVICSLCGIEIDANILFSTVGLITASLGLTMWTPTKTN